MKIETNIPDLCFETGKNYTIYYPMGVVFSHKLKLNRLNEIEPKKIVNFDTELSLSINICGIITKHSSLYYRSNNVNEIKLKLYSASYGEVRLDAEEDDDGVKMVSWRHEEMPIIIPNFTAFEEIW